MCAAKERLVCPSTQHDSSVYDSSFGLSKLSRATQAPSGRGQSYEHQRDGERGDDDRGPENGGDRRGGKEGRRRFPYFPYLS